MYLVTKSKWGGNVLAYDTKTSEYVYLRDRKEIWREKGESHLFDYFNYLRATGECIDGEALEECPEFHIFERYSEDCMKTTIKVLRH